MSLNIITNGQTRELVTFDELTPKHQDRAGPDPHNLYVVYKDWPYAIGDFMGFESDTWDGHISESWRSGVVIKVTDDGVIMGRYY